MSGAALFLVSFSSDVVSFSLLSCLLPAGQSTARRPSTSLTDRCSDNTAQETDGHGHIY